MKKISDSYEKPIPKISSSDTYQKNLKKLIENNSKARTWKEKLQFINDMILNKGADAHWKRCIKSSQFVPQSELFRRQQSVPCNR